MNRNEAIDIVRKNWPCDRHQLSEALETLIPELKENEDEGIRKWIKKELESKYVVGNTVNNVMADKAFAWLEKHGEQTNPYSGISFEYNGHIWGMCARDNGVDILLDKQLFKHLEKQGEKKKTAMEAWKEMRLEVYAQASGNRHEPNCSDDNSKIFSINDIDEIFEKISDCVVEQKPETIIIPKFREGDWIVYKDDYTKEEDVLVISNLDSKGTSLYTTDGHQKYYLSWESLKKARLWTIEDAKEGDVLSTDVSVFIYAKVLYNKPYAYCGVNTFGFFKANCLEHDWANSVYNVHPANKEQRDLLFQKMHEAGYEWDAVKKELKRIEQNPDELPNGEKILVESKSTCYHNDGLYYAIDILETTLGKVEGYQSDDGILEHKCAISAVKQLKQLVDFCSAGNSDKSSEKDMTEYNKNFECGKQDIKAL